MFLEWVFLNINKFIRKQFSPGQFVLELTFIFILTFNHFTMQRILGKRPSTGNDDNEVDIKRRKEEATGTEWLYWYLGGICMKDQIVPKFGIARPLPDSAISVQDFEFTLNMLWFIGTVLARVVIRMRYRDLVISTSKRLYNKISWIVASETLV